MVVGLRDKLDDIDPPVIDSCIFVLVRFDEVCENLGKLHIMLMNKDNKVI